MAVPAAPVLTGVTAGDNSLSVAFTQADADPVVAGFQYQLDGKGGWVDASSDVSPVVIGGLKNGRAYSVKLRSGNADGFSPASNALPGTPADADATNDNGWDDASWAANPGLPSPNRDYNDPDD